MVRKAKEEYVVGLCVNGYSTIVIIKSDYLTLVNPESESWDEDFDESIACGRRETII